MSERVYVNDNEKLSSAEKKAEVMDLYLNPESLMHCKNCKHRLGFWRIFIRAVGKKQGVLYRVQCPKCGYRNPYTKGGFKHGINPR